MSEEQFVVLNEYSEISIKDNASGKYPFALAYESNEDGEALLQECLNIANLLNSQAQDLEDSYDANGTLESEILKLMKERLDLLQENIIYKNAYLAMKDLEKENEELTQFRNKTLNLIYEQINRNEEAIDEVKELDVDTGYLVFHTEMLKILKKRLLG